MCCPNSDLCWHAFVSVVCGKERHNQKLSHRLANPEINLSSYPSSKWLCPRSHLHQFTSRWSDRCYQGSLRWLVWSYPWLIAGRDFFRQPSRPRFFSVHRLEKRFRNQPKKRKAFRAWNGSPGRSLCRNLGRKPACPLSLALPLFPWVAELNRNALFSTSLEFFLKLIHLTLQYWTENCKSKKKETGKKRDQLAEIHIANWYILECVLPREKDEHRTHKKKFPTLTRGVARGDRQLCRGSCSRVQSTRGAFAICPLCF